MVDLRKTRKKTGLTQFDVERITSIDASTLSLYENGIRIPTVKDAQKLGKLYGFQWSEIYEGVDYDEQGIWWAASGKDC